MSVATEHMPAERETPFPASREAESPAAPAAPDKPERLMSLDAYRGFVMLAMAAAGLNLAKVAKDTFANNKVWQILAYQTDHVGWVGCGFWDLIQPSFMFMVGVAMPFSFASRAAKGATRGNNFIHVAFRSVLLIILGVFLSSNGAAQTDYTFVNVLTQIGLGYAFVYLLLGRGWKLQLLAIAVILIGYTALFALYPARGAGPEFGVKPDDNAVFSEAYAAHWNKNANVAHDADVWLLNQLPQPLRKDPASGEMEPHFFYNNGGYQTLNFVPSIATMLFGLMTGEWLRSRRSRSRKVMGLFAAGLLLLAVGLVVDHYIWPDWLADGASRLAAALGLSGSPFFSTSWTLCPIVKRIWTPSWAIFSTGWTLLMLGGFFCVIDIWNLRRWSFPLIVVGMNSIAMYCMAQLMKGWVRGSLKTNFGQDLFTGLSNAGVRFVDFCSGKDYALIFHHGEFAPIIDAVLVLFMLWLVCLWMYRQKSVRPNLSEAPPPAPSGWGPSQVALIAAAVILAVIVGTTLLGQAGVLAESLAAAISGLFLAICGAAAGLIGAGRRRVQNWPGATTAYRVALWCFFLAALHAVKFHMAIERETEEARAAQYHDALERYKKMQELKDGTRPQKEP